MTNLLSKNRDLTDESLDSERKKTDTALCNEVSTIEQLADLQLKTARSRLDISLIQDRIESDSFLAMGQEVDPLVKEERRRVDQRIANQRDEVDEALRQERFDLKAGKDDLLKSERLQTDLNLRMERQQTDEAYSDSRDLLKLEQDAHAETKAAIDKRDDVLAIVSHDLQDPLAIIKLCSDEVLGAAREQRLSNVEVQWVDTIRRHAGNMHRLVTDLLAAESIKKGKYPIHLGPCNLSLVVREMLQNFEILATRQGLSLVADLPATDAVAVADQERVRQVLANLISNALKFTQSGGTITVSLGEAAGLVKVSVADSGPGIAEVDRDKIFERFSQVGRQDRRGVGLGLFISKWMVEAQGGSIGVESAEGAGSTFHFTLPSTVS